MESQAESSSVFPANILVVEIGSLTITRWLLLNGQGAWAWWSAGLVDDQPGLEPEARKNDTGYAGLEAQQFFIYEG